MEKIHVIGVGPGGGLEYLIPAALRAVEKSNVLVGGERNLALFKHFQGETFVIKNNLAEMICWIKEKRVRQKVSVLASGDPGMFGILSYLKRHFASGELYVIPGISAAQIACARLALPWHDAAMVSTHGRDRAGLLDTVRREKKVVALAGPEEPPADMARAMVEAGIKGKKVYICANLTYPDEEIVGFRLAALADLKRSWDKKNYVMVIIDE